MKVHIEKKLYLESDERNYILKEYNGKHDAKGNELFKAISYHGTLHSVIRKLIDMKIKESTATNLQELITDVRRVEEWVHKIVGEV